MACNVVMTRLAQRQLAQRPEADMYQIQIALKT